jgi:hypothetical protein
VLVNRDNNLRKHARQQKLELAVEQERVRRLRAIVSDAFHHF